MHGLWIVFHKFVQVARNGSFQFWSSVVKSTQSSLKSHCIDDSVALAVALVELFFFLLEAPEIVLNEESGVELAYRHFVIN